MAENKEPQKYRAGVGTLILNENKEILMVQNQSFREDEWDFVKGGMHLGENEEDTIKREVSEELGPDFKYNILRRSSWNIIYEWPLEKQIEKGFRGQARVSYWLMYVGGDIKLDTEEIRNFKWIPTQDLEQFLVKGGWSSDQYSPLIDDLKRVLEELK